MDFERWFLTNGGFIHKDVEIVSTSNGRAVQVRSGSCIEPGTEIVSCPHRCSISYADSRKYGLLSNKISDVSSLPQSVATRLFLVKQYLLQENSFWYPYISILPQPHDENAFNTAICFGKDDEIWLRGTNLGRAAIARKAAWREEFDHAHKLLFSSADDEASMWTWCVACTNS